MSNISNSASVDTFGALVSSLVRYLRWFLLSTNLLPFIFMHLFCFKNIRYWSALFLWSLDISCVFFGLMSILLCSCLISFRTAATLVSPKTIITLDTCYWVRMLVTIGSHITLCCWLGSQCIVACRRTYSLRYMWALIMLCNIMFAWCILDRFISLFIFGCIRIFGGRSHFRFLTRMSSLDFMPYF